MAEFEINLGSALKVGAALGIAGVVGFVGVPVAIEAHHQGQFTEAIDERANAVAANHGNAVGLEKFTAEEQTFDNADSAIYEAAHNLADNPTKIQKMAAGCLLLTTRGQSWGEENAVRWQRQQVTAGVNSCREKIQNLINTDPTHRVTFRLLNGLVENA